MNVEVTTKKRKNVLTCMEFLLIILWDCSDGLPNILQETAKNMVVRVKHWPPDDEAYRKKGYVVPVNLPSIFSVPLTLLRKNRNAAPRNVEARNVDAESRPKCDEAKMQTADPDIIDDRLILTDIIGVPPKLTFSFTIFEDFKICCYKGLT